MKSAPDKWVSSNVWTVATFTVSLHRNESVWVVLCREPSFNFADRLTPWASILGLFEFPDFPDFLEIRQKAIALLRWRFFENG